MNIETTKTATTQLLNEYYQISTQAIPTQRVKSEWQADNKREFHKTTYLIWCMAGGVESDDEYCPYDDNGCTPVDYQKIHIGTFLALVCDCFPWIVLVFYVAHFLPRTHMCNTIRSVLLNDTDQMHAIHQTLLKPLQNLFGPNQTVTNTAYSDHRQLNQEYTL
ncbi:hypothetical protein BATDEDRAFT_23787 [Batrachochytrium dendrobatidis JAM81]|uniref:Uncharacterized protein n=1 Tax=Batrachochytrium dendrobatidis (strain JAM81 / FGSC 10211) TaxID=684364 RepID=F4P070_BATDJ|nr:uncharacterized protein BATDEDRAFT_23787 [Batrachochytrium dendrobatidis JAM81]EGF81392.1 hypothetical protein BATDEDRAFT_23787 [Batrachochytrium dendrobatidis JAM81]|eukprot:XP_006677834.1 hypothetical protein BATDEDRAFT_23787 [Batrachochytrium dendrobatidis JAM81]